MIYRTTGGYYYTQQPSDTINWDPWKEKFAWLPVNWKGEWFWWQKYYFRTGIEYAPIAGCIHITQIASIFEILSA